MSSTVNFEFLATKGAPPTSPRGKKREAQIIKVATSEFLKYGYSAASLDRICKIAGGSKSTLYRFFPSKADLFQAVVMAIVANHQGVSLDPDQNIGETLFKFCRSRLKVVFAKQHWSLLTLIQAERDRFPRIAEAYYKIGPLYSREMLSQYFQTLVKRGQLTLDDPDNSARFFTAALMHEWYLQYLYTSARFPTDEEVKQHSNDVVDSFLNSVGLAR